MYFVKIDPISHLVTFSSWPNSLVTYAHVSLRGQIGGGKYRVGSKRLSHHQQPVILPGRELSDPCTALTHL